MQEIFRIVGRISNGNNLCEILSTSTKIPWTEEKEKRRDKKY